MTKLGRPAFLLVVATLVAAAFAVPARAAPPAGNIPPAELARIERLIDVVAHSTDRCFVRNGAAYDAATAARFLRLKWEHSPELVHTAEDFIREIGSRSGTSGNRYRVRGPDGTEEDSATFLTRLLAQSASVAAN